MAEKRAAIEAVLKRLQGVGLGELVLDLHEGMRSRRQTAEQLARALETAHTAHNPDVAELQRALLRNREKLSHAESELHELRAPWGLSIYELQSRILVMGESSDIRVSLHGAELERLHGEAVLQTEDDLREYVNLGGSALEVSKDAPWSSAHRASSVITKQQASTAAQMLDELSTERLPAFRQELDQLVERLQISSPLTLAAAAELLDALRGIQTTQASFTSAVFEEDLETLIERLEPGRRGVVGRLRAWLVDPGYRAAVTRARTLTRVDALSATEAHARLTELRATLDNWRCAAVSAPTTAIWDVSPDDCRSALDRCVEAWANLHRYAALDIDPGGLKWSEYRARLGALERDRRVLFRLPRLHELRGRLKERGLGPLVEAAHRAGLDGNEIVQAFSDAWTRSVLDAVRGDAPTFAAFDAAGLYTAVAEFRSADREHIKSAPDRVVRAWAEAVVAARDTYPEQSQLIAHEARKKRRHLPTRDLFAQAPDVLTALKPCWVMSPLVVAQLLPLTASPPFDVVVFDEASQIPPADAISSLLRGRQAVVAGDPKQLPPGSFFTSSSEDEEEDEGHDAPLTEDVESILDVMSVLLQSTRGRRMLGWHYRSRDERLIAFSNHHVYDRSLTTFPGAIPDECVTHVEVPFSVGASSISGSYSPEVEQVVELVLLHAAERSDESLGVIALGSVHANRIAEALRLRRRDRPELDDFFSETNQEPFFVKNLERVQGDERDAIILTIGYGRTADGRMRYNFGPINQEGGWRRLNVAVTRAKRRMTAVSCFSADDMDPERLHNDGVRMLRDYIAYAGSGGRVLGSVDTEAPPLNPFELDIKRRLEARGMSLQTQYGVSGYRIDFAVMHPQERGRPILAIEADGAQYHSAQSTRDRDRLRQENLERLGWRFHRIWSTEWFHNPELEADRAYAAYERSLDADALIERSDAPPPVVAAPASLASAPLLQRRGPKPQVTKGQPITAYSESALVDLVRWIESDDRLRTEDELLGECVVELGYRRCGHRIIEALQTAIATARSNRSAPQP